MANEFMSDHGIVTDIPAAVKASAQQDGTSLIFIYSNSCSHCINTKEFFGSDAAKAGAGVKVDAYNVHDADGNPSASLKFESKGTQENPQWVLSGFTGKDGQPVAFEGFPMFLQVDAQGQVVNRWTGAVNAENFKEFHETFGAEPRDPKAIAEEQAKEAVPATECKYVPAGDGKTYSATELLSQINNLKAAKESGACQGL